jgi:hypothetical protein
MALKKRGFNVDRILNQQREERLRVQAEETARQRDAREKQAALPPPPPPSAGPPVYDDSSEATSTTAFDNESIGSGGSKKSSLLDRLRRHSRDMKGSGSPEPPMPMMPGGLAGFGKGKFGSGLSGPGGALGGGAGLGGAGMGGSGHVNGQTTKRVGGDSSV